MHCREGEDPRPDDGPGERTEDDLPIDDAGIDRPFADRRRHLERKTKSAITLNIDAHATACCGFSTPVETTVAIELAAS